MPTQALAIDISEADGRTDVRLTGPLDLATVTDLRAGLGAVRSDAPAVVDLSGISRLDTAGAWALSDFGGRLKAADQLCRFDGLNPSQQALLDTVEKAMPHEPLPPAPPWRFSDLLEQLGRAVVGGLRFAVDLTGYLGLFLARLARSVVHPREFRLTALVAHCQDVGVNAVPIVALMAFLIGIVLAFQGATQLKQFGAEVFVVDLIAVSILRELGILLTAIIVAGRTASAFTAAIGSMKMREEVDAMRTLGIDPAAALFVPRILALVLMLPLLGLVANVMGLIGGGLMAWINLGISPPMFVTRLIENTDVSHVLVGMVKAPVFALIIGVVGCQAGMQVEGNAESLGRMTSSAVVTAIFAVIVADAVFSVFFATVGL